MEDNITIDAEEKQKRENRLKRFGPIDTEYLGKISNNKKTPENVELAQPKESYKIMLDKDGQFDKKKLMLFGVNLMNTGDIEKYLNQFELKIKKIFWLNDFSCLVEFDTEEIAMNAYKILSSSGGEEEKKEENDTESLDWRKAKSFVKMNRELEIEVRVAQVGDIDKKSEKGQSVFYEFYKDSNDNNERKNKRFNKGGRRNNSRNRNRFNNNRNKYRNINRNWNKQKKEPGEEKDKQKSRSRSRDNGPENGPEKQIDASQEAQEKPEQKEQ